MRIGNVMGTGVGAAIRSPTPVPSALSLLIRLSSCPLDPPHHHPDRQNRLLALSTHFFWHFAPSPSSGAGECGGLFAFCHWACRSTIPVGICLFSGLWDLALISSVCTRVTSNWLLRQKNNHLVGNETCLVRKNLF